MRRFRKRPGQKAKAATLVTVIVLLVVSSSMFFLSNVTNQVIELRVIGESVKFVEAGQTAEFLVEAENRGPVNTEVNLEIFDIPEGWEAELSDEELILHPGEIGVVFLSVTAPSTPSGELAQIAEIGVRAPGNATIGTLTILRGSASVMRDGVTTPLGSRDEIRSGDIVSTMGESVITIDPNKFINASKTYAGNIYVLLSDATVGFLRWQDTAYMTLISGEVTIWIPGGGGGRRGRAPPPAPVINLSKMDIIDTKFPGLEYNVVMEFGSLEEHSFFFLNVTEENTTVEVFEGEVTVGSEVNTRPLTKFEQTTAVRTVEVPEPLSVQRTIIALESNGSIEASVRSLERSVLDLPDVHYMPTDELQIFVTPVLPEITIDLEGAKDGEYTVDITQITNFTGKTFGVRTTATENTTDDLAFENENLKFRNMEKDKSYDLTIGYEDGKTGEESEFEVVDVKTSEEEQKIAVDDWEKLDEAEEKSVSFSQGKKTIKVTSGMTGEEIENALEGKPTSEPIAIISIWLVVIPTVIVFIVAIVVKTHLWDRSGYVPDKKKKKE